MTPEIKKRIEQIQHGEIPEGYKKTKAGILPVDWEAKNLSDVLKKQTKKNTDGAITNVLTNSATKGIINQTEYFDKQIANGENVAGYYIVHPGYFVYNPRISVTAPCGPFNKYYGETTGIMSPLYTVYKYSEESLYYSEYLSDYFGSGYWHKYMNEIANYGARSDRMNVTSDDMNSLPLPYPPLAEQQKIAEILAAQDKVIELKEKLLEEKKKQKKYLMQQLLTGKKRLPGFDGEWEKRKLSEITFAAGRKNKGNLPLEPFAVTNDKGFIAQRNAHDDFGYMNNVDRSAYMVVKPNSFAYNPARINVGSIGYYDGKEDVIVSSLYEIFQTVDEVDDRFLWHWFKSSELMKWIKRLQEGSVRFYFYYDKLEECNLMMPSLAEQRKISECIDAMDLSIEIRERELNEEKQKKKALMQLLLTGIVRVNV